MARARIIKPGFFMNDEVAELSPAARLAFIGLWTIADQQGKLAYRPKRLKIELFPYDDVSIDDLVTAIADQGLIALFPKDGQTWIQIIDWYEWQPGARREPRGSDARKWRNAVLERDDYQCQECGAMDGLHAHHIKPWARFPELRLDIGNGVTLCTSCHKDVHRGGVK